MVTVPAATRRLDAVALTAVLQDKYPGAASVTPRAEGADLLIALRDIPALPSLARFLFLEAGGSFAGIIVEEWPRDWSLRYVFLLRNIGWVHVNVRTPLENTTLPSIVTGVHAADWYEREAEDLFGLNFEGHPRLGDFILHNETWQENIAPMRKRFSATQQEFKRLPDESWTPTLVVQDPGAFAMPVGPVYEGGLEESIHFLLETVGEDVVRAVPRLFYKYRAVEKMAEGRSIGDVLLLAERFAAISAFAHSLTFCQAVETVAGVELPPRAAALCELERLRHHAGAIEGICQSTALSVSEAHAAIIEEQLLRASGAFTGHRYLFGLNTPGGLRRDFEDASCRALLNSVDKAVADLNTLEQRLRFSSSFLDRLEDVGVVSPESARDLDLVGPVGRASGRRLDLRRTCPYAHYSRYVFEVPTEAEGDGYARLRVLFAEARASAGLIHQAIESLPTGEISNDLGRARFGEALAWVEAPLGGAVQWLRLDSSLNIERWRILTPSFRNWIGFHVAVEDFAFQDFPIILATFGLSAAECDR